MKIVQQVIDSVSTSTRLKLALALGCSEQWIIKVLAANKSNGPLTTYSALEVLRKETGLSDSEILEEEAVMGEQN